MMLAQILQRGLEKRGQVTEIHQPAVPVLQHDCRVTPSILNFFLQSTNTTTRTTLVASTKQSITQYLLLPPQLISFLPLNPSLSSQCQQFLISHQGIAATFSKSKSTSPSTQQSYLSSLPAPFPFSLIEGFLNNYAYHAHLGYTLSAHSTLPLANYYERSGSTSFRLYSKSSFVERHKSNAFNQHRRPRQVK